MEWLQERIKIVESLLERDSESDVLYAALEARLTLELVAYERLRTSHDYISSKDLRRWQPKDVVNILINEVDPYTVTTRTISVAEENVPGTINKDPDFLVIGTQVGFDPATIGKLWNALSSFLHVRMPRNTKDQLVAYPDSQLLRDKIKDTLSFLAPLSKSSVSTSGMGLTVSFQCECGSTNKRRANLLKNNQVIQCINPHCESSFRVEIDNEKINFIKELVELECTNCSAVFTFKARPLLKLSRELVAHSACLQCGTVNYFQWRLCRVEKSNTSDDESS
jgi:hypothetical protein